MKKLCVVMAWAVLLCGMVGLTGCCEKEEKREYKIEIYDDNWEKLTWENGRDRHFAYDGEVKFFNAIAFCNDKEFARLDYRDEKSFDKKISVRIDEMASSTVYKGGDEENANNFGVKDYLPYQKGQYFVVYGFKMKAIYDGEYLPLNVETFVTIFID